MLKVLIVEDNADYRHWLHRLLADWFPHIEIGEAVDAEDGLQQALSMRFGLIFMDIRLPRGNGLDLTKVIKSAFPESIVCVISSHAMPEYREAAFLYGADYFLVKGAWSGAQIVDLVESLLPGASPDAP